MGQAAEDGEDSAWIDAATDRHREVAVVGEDPVGRRQRQRRAHLRRLVAGDWPPEAKFALPLEVQPLLVESAADDHHAVQLAKLLIADVGDTLALRCQHAVLIEQRGDGIGAALLGLWARMQRLGHSSSPPHLSKDR